MKKTFTLLTMLLSIFMFANAQTIGKKLVFATEDETEITDGAVINVEVPADLEGDSISLDKVLSLTNKADVNLRANIKMRVTNITGGELLLATLDYEGTIKTVGDFETAEGVNISQRDTESEVFSANFSGLKTQSATVVVELYASTINEDGTFGEKELQQTITLVFNKQTQKNSLVFVDKQGNVIEDGATIYLDDAVEDKYRLGWKKIDSGLSIRNIGADNLRAMLEAEVVELKGRANFQVCYPEECNYLENTGDKVSTLSKNILAEAPGNTAIDTEFKFSTSKPSIGILNMQIFSAKQSGGDYIKDQPQAKVKLVFNSKATGVELLSANVAERYNVFNAQGMLIVGNAAKIEGLKQGVYVVQTLKNNKVVDTKKYIVK